MKKPALVAFALAASLGVVPALAATPDAGQKAASAPTDNAKASATPPAAPATAPADDANAKATPPAGTQTAATTPPDNAQAQPSAANRTDVGTATINPTGLPPSQRNPLLADNGDVRIGKLIGTNIYNKNDKKIGSVDDVLAGSDGHVQVVIDTNNKKVIVPWDKLQFGDAKLNSDNKVLMPDETQAELNKMPAFNYKDQNNKG